MDPGRFYVRRLDEFTDILAERDGRSDLWFMSKDWEPVTTIRPVHRFNPKMIKHEVFVSPRVQAVIEDISNETGKTKPLLCIEVHEILDEIGFNRSMPVIRWMGYMLIKIMRKICCGLMVNEESVNRMKSIMGNIPLVFAPSHRSYADFIILSYVCFHYDIEIPVVAAGMDFQQIYVMGKVLRECCAFYMKRTFGSDKLYWAVFGEYVSMLLVNNDAPVEFFIEGTRSRSAKTLTPKLGFLSMVLEPLFCGEVHDIAIVPITISYDRTLEEDLFAYELLGAPKPRESATGLLKALTLLSGCYGRVYVDFSEPISVRQYILDLFPKPSSTERGPRLRRELKIIPSLAYEIIREQQHHGVLTAFNLICVVLNHSLFIKPQTLGVGAMGSEIMWLRDVMLRFGALVDFQNHQDIDDVVIEALTVHQNLVFLSSRRSVTLNMVHRITEDEEYELAPGHSLLSETMLIAVPAMMLHHYINPCLNFLIQPAVVAVILQSLRTILPRVGKVDLFRRYHYLRMLLLQDFVLGKAYEIRDFQLCLDAMESLNLVELTHHDVEYGRNKPLQQMLVGLLRPYFFSYLMQCVVIKQSGYHRSLTDLTQDAQKRMELLLLSGYPVPPYSLSLDVFSAAVRSLDFMNAVEKVKLDGVWLYKSGEEMNTVMMEIDKYIPCVLEMLMGRNSTSSNSSSETLVPSSSTSSTSKL